MPINLEMDSLENWSQVIKDTDVQYHKVISTIKPLISFDNVASNDVDDLKYDPDACVAVFHKTKELTIKKQKLQQEKAKLSKEIEDLNNKNKVLEENLESCKEKCLQASSQNKTYKNLLKTAIDKYENNLDLVVTIENKTDTLYEATFKIKSRKKKVLKVLIDRAKAEIIDCTTLHELPYDADIKDIPNILYLLRKSFIEK